MNRITFFRSPSDLRKWFEKHHRTAGELRIGYYKKGSGKPSITWPESVDEALCFGWIDGIRHSIDDVSYTIRFTPRKPSSIWSAVNIRRARKLKADGLMLPEGLQAFQQYPGSLEKKPQSKITPLKMAGKKRRGQECFPRIAYALAVRSSLD